ncbi:MAG: putative metallopeptidase [Verrucomicrobiae bacterium]
MSEPKEEKKGKYFTLAPESVHQLCRELIQLYHSDLDSAAVKVDIVMAFRDPDGDTYAMEKDGHRVLGQATTIKLKDRVKGMGDVEIMLDGDAWDGLPQNQKAALLDHELEHFECKRDKVGEFVFDDLVRPVIKLRPHDRQFGWFDNIARRHRSDSMEIDQLRRLFIEAGQIYLPFVKDLGEEDLAERIDEALEKGGTIPAVLDDGETTMSVSVNGGPAIPMKPSKLLKKIKEKVEGAR